jgi:hypothetical protein
MCCIEASENKEKLLDFCNDVHDDKHTASI